MLKKLIKNLIVAILISKCYCEKVKLRRCMSCPIITDKMIIEHKKTTKIHNYDNSNEDIDPIKANNITLTIDIKLQEYAESLLKNKKGGVKNGARP